ncbi:Hypothetical predicted protein [Podarcis lilfordi]|uniref:Uncharacterized protein n=1 Tax=Podarcis lilfordi TaxID=74358 RepID=A0AA35KWU9_9SAUR|nr:Hypothetical predicted protein [Podarcis lilfordi]
MKAPIRSKLCDGILHDNLHRGQPFVEFSTAEREVLKGVFKDLRAVFKEVGETAIWIMKLLHRL